MPDFEKKAAQVKINTAALKREGYQLDKERKEQEKRLTEMAMGLHDSTEFDRWRREMNEKD